MDHEPSSTYTFRMTGPRPYFAEAAYYLWGEVDYDSEGDCKYPTDRDWTCLEITNRNTDQGFILDRDDDSVWELLSDDPIAGRVARFLEARCEVEWIGPPPALDPEWDHNSAMRRADHVHDYFQHPEFAPFDNKLFWGSWKWTGWFASEFTWTGRWIMHSLLTKDPRAVYLCVDWLRTGTFNAQQSEMLRQALTQITGRTNNRDWHWIVWYYVLGGKKLYPKPDMKKWLEELKSRNSVNQ